MDIRGKLKDDILNGNAVLFLGAGIGIAAGLFGAKELSEFLLKESGNQNAFIKFKNDFGKLVALLDKDPQFTRNWTNGKLADYFIDDSNYKNLESHVQLLQYQWKAIFTTNYDLCIEKASQRIHNKKWRLLPISNPKYQSIVKESNPNKLKYFKIHGCVDDIDKNPNDSSPLVITQKDFISSIKRNKVFWDELERYALGSSIIFIGFNAHNVENNHILASIFDVQHELTRNFEQSYSPFAVLPKVDEETKDNFNEIGINILEGSLDDFLSSLPSKEKNTTDLISNIEKDTIEVTYARTKVLLNESDIAEYHKQFYFYHKQFFEENKSHFDNLIIEKKIDSWKNQPTIPFIYSGYCVTRTQFVEAKNIVYKLLTEIIEKKSPRLFILNGKRASGKTIFIHQLAYEFYRSQGNPVLILNNNANVIEMSDKSEKEFIISGWNSRVFDKFISLFHNDQTERNIEHIPIIVADHISYRQYALDSLIKQLDNHAKPILLFLTINEDEYNSDFNGSDSDYDRGIRLSYIFKFNSLQLAHKLDDDEINQLFNSISRNFNQFTYRRDILISKAKDKNESDRDILFILYQWFDKNFRRLEEIISDESKKLIVDIRLKTLYLSIASFYRYNLKPPMKACISAANISLNEYQVIRDTSIFKAFIDISFPNIETDEHYGFSRHPEFARRIFQILCPSQVEQYQIMNDVLKSCSSRDLDFVRAFFNYIYVMGYSFKVENVTDFKESTEQCQQLKDDPILNHQFGAYLLRENTNLDDARYYLDIALNEEPDNPAFIHAVGNLHYHLYKTYLELNDINKAIVHYDYAKEFFERDRSVRQFPDEHAYVTDIDMTRHRSESSQEQSTDRILFSAESDALFLEAIKVVPPENQNVLGKKCKPGKRFSELPQENRDTLVELINEGKASGILLQYYTEDLLNNPKQKNWVRLKNIVDIYIKSSDLRVLIPIMIVSKRAFILSAENRFEILRDHYDKLIRYQEEKISFTLVAEYVKLLIIDAFVLGKYKFITSVMSDIQNKLFIKSFPRFLKDEYILSKELYVFDETDERSLKDLFIKFSNEFDYNNYAQRYERFARIGSLNDMFVRIEIDQSTRFWVKAIRKEIATISSKVNLRFNIKYAWDGLKATDFIV
ncbi:MAG: hypothetical protein HOO86_09495 [Bacteroidales bacterium]|nr:hypothetical protein [Bacteroidales bacterium]